VLSVRAAGARARTGRKVYAGGRFWRVPHSLSPGGGKVRSQLNRIRLCVNFAIKIAWRGCEWKRVSYRANVNFLYRCGWHLQRLYCEWWKGRRCQSARGIYIELLWCHGLLWKWFMWNMKHSSKGAIFRITISFEDLNVKLFFISMALQSISMIWFDDTGTKRLKCQHLK
jgi:hypothetical protein